MLTSRPAERMVMAPRVGCPVSYHWGLGRAIGGEEITVTPGPWCLKGGSMTRHQFWKWQMVGADLAFRAHELKVIWSLFLQVLAVIGCLECLDVVYTLVTSITTFPSDSCCSLVAKITQHAFLQSGSATKWILYVKKHRAMTPVWTEPVAFGVLPLCHIQPERYLLLYLHIRHLLQFSGWEMMNNKDTFWDKINTELQLLYFFYLSYNGAFILEYYWNIY